MNRQNRNNESTEDQTDWETGWFGCKYKKREKTAIRAILNYIILPLALFADIVVYGINFGHLCGFVWLYLVLNLPVIKGPYPETSL